MAALAAEGLRVALEALLLAGRHPAAQEEVPAVHADHAAQGDALAHVLEEGVARERLASQLLRKGRELPRELLALLLGGVGLRAQLRDALRGHAGEAGRVGQLLEREALGRQPLLRHDARVGKHQQYAVDFLLVKAAAEEERAVFGLRLAAKVVPVLDEGTAEVDAHTLHAQQLLEVDLEQGEGLQPAYELAVVVREAHGAVALRGEARDLAGGLPEPALAVFERVARVLEAPELGLHAQLAQERHGALQRRAVDVVAVGDLELAPAAQRSAGLHRLELAVEHERAYGLVHLLNRARDYGSYQFFRCQVSAPLLKVRYVLLM